MENELNYPKSIGTVEIDALDKANKRDLALYISDMKRMLLNYEELNGKMYDIIYNLMDISRIDGDNAFIRRNLMNMEDKLSNDCDLFGMERRRKEHEQREAEREKKIAKAKRLKAKGKTFEEIAKECDMSESILRRILH